jgi:hypothetical protein
MGKPKRIVRRLAETDIVSRVLDTDRLRIMMDTPDIHDWGQYPIAEEPELSGEEWNYYRFVQYQRELKLINEVKKARKKL